MTPNIGVIHGGVKVNIVPCVCWFEADIRVPPHLGKEEILAKIHQIVERYPEATFEQIIPVDEEIAAPEERTRIGGAVRRGQVEGGEPAGDRVVAHRPRRAGR